MAWYWKIESMPFCSSSFWRGGALKAGTGGGLAAPLFSCVSDFEGEATTSFSSGPLPADVALSTLDAPIFASSEIFASAITLLISGMIISNFFLYKSCVILLTLSSIFALHKFSWIKSDRFHLLACQYWWLNSILTLIFLGRHSKRWYWEVCWNQGFSCECPTAHSSYTTAAIVDCPRFSFVCIRKNN